MLVCNYLFISKQWGQHLLRLYWLMIILFRHKNGCGLHSLLLLRLKFPMFPISHMVACCSRRKLQRQGSVILAAILLKMGGYGIFCVYRFRFSPKLRFIMLILCVFLFRDCGYLCVCCGICSAGY